MSMGGAFLAISNTDYNKAINQELNLFDFVDNKDNDFLLCSVEQAWDAIRVLLENKIPELFGSEPVDIDIGEMAMLIDTQFVNSQLQNISNEEILKLLNEPAYLNSDFYWNETFTNEEEFESIIELINNIKTFFNNATLQDKSVIFYIN